MRDTVELIAAAGLDIAVVVLLCVSICRAWKKGFLRTVIQMAAYIVIFGVSLSASQAAAPVLYKKVVEPMIFEKLTGSDEKIDNAQLCALLPSFTGVLLREEADAVGGEESENLSAAASSAPERDAEEGNGETKSALEQLLEQLGEMSDLSDLSELDFSQLDLSQLDMEELLGAGEGLLSDGMREQLMHEVADRTIRPAAVSALTAICFAVLFVSLSLVANLLLAALGVIRYLPLISTVNAALGGVVGVLQGLLLVWVIALLLYSILEISGGSWWFFNSAVIDQTFLFRYFVHPGLLTDLMNR